MNLLLIAALAVAAASPSSGGDDAYMKRWNELSASSDEMTETPTGKRYEHQMIEVHNTFWKEVFAKCADAAREEPVDVFKAIAVIDAEGKITEFLPSPHSEYFQCFVNEMTGRRYPAPPVAPFYESYRIRIRAADASAR